MTTPNYIFTVPGNPIPKARPRVVNGHAYTPAKTVAWEQTIRLHYQGPKFEGPISITMSFFRKNKTRCDYDNLAKAITDALNGVAFSDDSSIIEAHIYKSVDPINPCVLVKIEQKIE